ncbi:hypothetical protein AB6D11_06170 [Vibrio splendidus]
MSNLVTMDYAIKHRITKRYEYHSNYPLLVRACFASAMLNDGIELSRNSLLKSASIEHLVKVARDPTSIGEPRNTVSKYLLSIRGMTDEFHMSPMIMEQHASEMLLLCEVITDLEHFHGGEANFSECLAINHGPKDIQSLIDIIELI